jgi:hypothetical protein
LLEDNKNRELDCGALYHAARGLRLYRNRRFGPSDLGSATVARATTAASSSDHIQPPAAKSDSNDDTAPPPPTGIGQ